MRFKFDVNNCISYDLDKYSCLIIACAKRIGSSYVSIAEAHALREGVCERSVGYYRVGVRLIDLTASHMSVVSTTAGHIVIRRCLRTFPKMRKVRLWH